MPVSLAANRLANSVSRCIIARIPTEAAGLAATAVSRDSIGVDGSEGSNVSGVSGTVVLPREYTGSPHRPACPPGAAPRDSGTRPVRFPEGVNGWTGGLADASPNVD